MRLPDGWDAELKNIESIIKEIESNNENIGKKMEADLKRIEKKYLAKMRLKELHKLRAKMDKTWENIRNEYSINHSEIKKRFKNYDEAAEVLANYWQGHKMSKRKLLDSIAGGSTLIYAEASRYAENLTAPDSPERNYVSKACDFLWKDYTR